MSLVNLLASARTALGEWRQRQRAYGELMALDDRTLADIGIHRSQIRSVVYGPDGQSTQDEAAADVGRWHIPLGFPVAFRGR